MLFELRQYQCISGKRDEFVRYMEETLIPYQVSQGVVVVGNFHRRGRSRPLCVDPAF